MNENYLIPDLSTWLQSQLPQTLILVNKLDEFMNKYYFIPDVLYQRGYKVNSHRH